MNAKGEGRYDPSYFIEVHAVYPSRKEPFYVVARICDGEFVQYPRDLNAYTDATCLGELIRDGFELKPSPYSK